MDATIGRKQVMTPERSWGLQLCSVVLKHVRVQGEAARTNLDTGSRFPKPEEQLIEPDELEMKCRKNARRLCHSDPPDYQQEAEVPGEEHLGGLRSGAHLVQEHGLEASASGLESSRTTQVNILPFVPGCMTGIVIKSDVT
jgi:hypothetical protein